MKKFFVLVVILAFGIAPVFAEEVNFDKVIKYQKKVMEVGFRILNANQIEKRMTFCYKTNNVVNASANSVSKSILVYKGILPFFDDDNELAAILSHEIAHGLDFHAGFWRQTAMSFNPVKYEKKADMKAVDLMVNAGYNPVALIIILNKITDEPKKFDIFMGSRPYTHPIGSDRLTYVYEYIYAKYPAYLADNDYKTNLYYQNFLLTSKKERELIRQKYNKENIVPVSNTTPKKK